ncbi:MAG TPA: carboxypeptidase regulatory-like domain-containing protein [Candidatus Binatia bacterium]|nr:carboxypeptidase regulatory-like domain-containing protein [Candidatus Binatia bacterium]
MRLPPFVFLLVCAFGMPLSLISQTTSATINGFVADASGAAVKGAEVLAVNDVTATQFTATTNSDGIYVLADLPPGPYRLQVSKVGFKTIVKPDIVLNLQDALSLNFTLPVGAFHEIVTVEGGAPLVNTESAAVSTVIDRGYVENMPLNGRSFQDLILLTPGIVTNSPQAGVNVGVTGEFSVNGQRTESNYYTVDGVSANIGTFALSTNAGGVSGSLPASTALGTTQGLVSVDALEEFRVQSSSYSAEYGRNPGGQFSFATRSGTNQWHGTAFDYVRNDFFDANDWFNDYFAQPLPALRQNDFGGTLGGPVSLPRLYQGRDRTFFFFSYEGLRLRQPQAATVSYVPDAQLRATTPPPLQAVIDAYPLANGADLGTGFAEFVGASSSPSQIDATSVRLDHGINDKLRLFFRFSDTSSNHSFHDFGVPSVLNATNFTTRTYTLGATSTLTNVLSNEFRVNFSTNDETISAAPGSFGGAAPVNLFALQGFTGGAGANHDVEVGLYFGIGTSQFHSATITQHDNLGKQKQWNLVDTVSWSFGAHHLKLGADFRRLDPGVFVESPSVVYRFFFSTSVQANSVDFGFGDSNAPANPIYSNLSLFAQDEWKLNPRATLSLGLRWELNPAPGASPGNLPYTLAGHIGDVASVSLAPEGTPLWQTSWFNFAPRLGAAVILRNSPGHELVARGGGGVFFDTAQQLGSIGYNGPGFSAMTPLFGALAGSPASFPLPAAEATPTIVNPPVAPYSVSVYGFSPHLQLPYTLEWNASLQQALGNAQSITASYVGARGSRLLEEQTVASQSLNPSFASGIAFIQNGLTSDYDALQLQYQRRFSGGLQALASYTWGHAIDYGSYNFVVPYERGNSDFDVRQQFSSALSYDLPAPFSASRAAGLILGHWGLDDRFTARTGFPVTLNGNLVFDPMTGQGFNSGLNVVAGVPDYISGSQCAALYYGLPCPGGRAINPNAFALPSGNNPGDAPRNFVRGFGVWQMDLALRRNFALNEKLKLQFRAEAFNVFNHPNFGTINSTYCLPSSGPGCSFGQSTATLANSLFGLSSLYQMGGARSLQFALRFVF